jgi:hypothetical protein
VSGSTSQILVLAMRSGGSSASHRPLDGPGSGERPGSHVIGTPRPRRGLADTVSEADLMQIEDTQRTPPRDPRGNEADVPASEHEPQSEPRRLRATVITAVVTAVVTLAAFGIALALMK